MKVSILRGGGIAGITTCTELTSDGLPPDARQRLEQLAAAVTTVPTARQRPQPDESLYRVTVEDATGERTVSHTETDLPTSVRALIDFVRDRPERRDTLQ